MDAQSGPPAYATVTVTPAPAATADASPPINQQPAVETDPSLTVTEAGVECALAQVAEEAGKLHRRINDPLTTAFKAGLCTGKVQTYMLAVQTENPACFPKISLEEGIAIFIKWAAANPGQGQSLYTSGLKAAFEDAVPCLKK